MYFASPEDAAIGRSRTYSLPEKLRLNQWALSGSWTITEESAVLDTPEGAINFRFHARDLNLVMGPVMRGGSVDFSVLLDEEPPGKAHGGDSDARGAGVAVEQRMYQLIRQPDPVGDRTFAIIFHSTGVLAPVFTFG
jgi:hypothetical protein